MKQSAGLPVKITTPFGSSAAAGLIRQVPTASQIGVTPGAASYTDGFPPLTATAIASGGYPPSIQDFNGLLNQMSAWDLWTAAAGITPYDATFQTAIGGYPNGAAVYTATTAILGRVWVSTVDNNTTNPDTGGAGWLALMLASDVLALIAANVRTRLSGSVNFYIATNGSDNNPGTQALPWATKQKAWNYIQQSVDLQGGQAVVNIADGTYSDTLLAINPIVGGYGNVSIPVPVLFTGSLNSIHNATNGTCFAASNAAVLGVQGLTLNASGTTGGQGCGLFAANGAVIRFLGNQFGNCAVAGVRTTAAGAAVADGSFAMNGSGQALLFASAGGNIYFNATLNVTAGGASSYSVATVWAQAGTVYATSATWAGSNVTGVRYNAALNGVINTNGAGASAISGSTAGTTSTGGQYN